MYRILLAEDDSALRFVYSKMKVWNECGFKIEAEVSNGKDALKLLENESFDLIVTDIRMPFVDGIELLRTIKERNIDICLIFISSYDEFEYARQGLVLGAFDYILKPVDDKKLRTALNRISQYISEKSQSTYTASNVSTVLENIGKSINESSFIKQICDYLSENQSRIVTMEEISEHFNFNKDYFGKMFKQSFGVTYNTFSTLLKMEYAKELIATGNYKTYQISDMLGYSSVNYFTKIFKSVVGKTPSEFKR